MQLSRFSNRAFENAFLGFIVNKAGFHVDLCIFGGWRKQCFGISTFTALSVIASPGQCHSFCPSKPFSRTYPVKNSWLWRCESNFRVNVSRAPINLNLSDAELFYFQSKIL